MARCRPVGECGPWSPSAPPLPFFRGRAAPPWILGRGGSLCQRSLSPAAQVLPPNPQRGN